MRRRRQIRIAHAEIDDIRSRVAGFRLGLVYLFEDIRRQTANAVELFHRQTLTSAALISQLNPGSFYHGFALLPAACPSSSLSGSFRAEAPFLAGCGRPSWWSRALARSLSSLTCSCSVIVAVGRSGGMSCTAGYW